MPELSGVSPRLRSVLSKMGWGGGRQILPLSNNYLNKTKGLSLPLLLPSFLVIQM